MAHGGTRYSDKEKAYIRENYRKLGSLAVAIHLRRSHASVRAQARKLGVVKQYGPRTRKSKVQIEAEAKVLVDVNDARGLRAVAIGEPIPVRDAERKLASFDKAIARAVRERDLGLAPGALLNQNALQ